MIGLKQCKLATEDEVESFNILIFPYKNYPATLKKTLNDAIFRSLTQYRFVNIRRILFLIPLFVRNLSKSGQRDKQ